MFVSQTGLTLVVLMLAVVDLSQCAVKKLPNFVIFLADDMGYGDLQSFGNPLASTPNIDALVKDGIKFTQFYSTSPLCSPARAALLTGRYPIRTGVWNDVDDTAAFLQENIGGLPHNEITIPEMLATQGYKSALVGKWQLGVGIDRQFLPIHHGFDHYFGIPFTHEDCPCDKCYYPNDDCEECITEPVKAFCQLLYDDEIIEQPVNLITLAERQTRAARSFIQSNACEGTPFFLLYSFLHPHFPQFAGRRFRNTTLGGPYTDSLAELDGGVGDVMDELRNSGVLDDTFIIFTSDNGADLQKHDLGGFNGIFRCGKSSTFEGGVRVPTIAYWRGRIESGVSRQLLSHLDIWPTLRSLSGLPDEDDIVLDGFDFSNVLFQNGESSRKSLLYYDMTPSHEEGPFAIRTTRHKAHYYTECTDKCDFDAIDEMCRANYSSLTYHDPPIIYDLLIDPEERDDISSTNDKLVQDMAEVLLQETSKLSFARSELKVQDPSYQLCCDPGCQPYPGCCQCPSQYTDALLPLYRDCEKLPLNHRNKCRRG